MDDGLVGVRVLEAEDKGIEAVGFGQPAIALSRRFCCSVSLGGNEGFFGLNI